MYRITTFNGSVVNVDADESERDHFNTLVLRKHGRIAAIYSSEDWMIAKKLPESKEHNIDRGPRLSR